MIILFRYINRRFFLILIMVLIAVMLLSFLIDTIESSKTISQEDVKASSVIFLLFNKFIVLSIQTFPLSVYISLLLVLYSLHIKNEYLSLMTSAIRPERLILLFSPAILVCGIIYYILADSILPEASKEVDRLLIFDFKRFTASWTYFYRDRNWFLGRDGVIYHYNEIDENSRSMKDFSLYKLSEDGVEKVLFAKRLQHQGGKKYLSEGVREFIFGEDGKTGYDAGISKSITLADDYDIFRQRRGRPFQMSLPELINLIEIRERVGMDTSRYRYEMYNRIFYPLSFVSLCLFILFLFIKRLYLMSSRYIIFYGMVVLLLFFLLQTFAGKLSEASINKPFFVASIPFASLFLMIIIILIVDGFNRANRPQKEASL